MNRRDFLRRLTVGGIATATAAREWPFRVFSFPQEIKIAPIARPEQFLKHCELQWDSEGS